jgi:hypothetical protein
MHSLESSLSRVRGDEDFPAYFSNRHARAENGFSGPVTVRNPVKIRVIDKRDSGIGVSTSVSERYL